MTQTKIVNFVGSPSVGKSLMAALTFAELKGMHRTAELVQEYAKTLVWQERFEELNCQWMVSMEQYKLFKSINNKVEFVCTDSPLLLGLFYNVYNSNNVSDVPKTEQMILSKMQEFHNVYIFLERNDDHPYEMVGRIHNQAQSNEIQIHLRSLLDKLKIPYLSVKSNVYNIQNIIKYVLES